jgi:hypothetical protein
MSDEHVNVCNCFHCLHAYGLLILNNHNYQNKNNIKLFGFLSLDTLTNLENMEPIHVEESFEIVTNESEIPLEEENEDERSKRSTMLPSS